jgi:hypothetical protein
MTSAVTSVDPAFLNFSIEVVGGSIRSHSLDTLDTLDTLDMLLLHRGVGGSAQGLPSRYPYPRLLSIYPSNLSNVSVQARVQGVGVDGSMARRPRTGMLRLKH